MYARPVLADDIESGKKSYALWTWAKQDAERNFSIIDVRRGVFNLPEKPAAGGRVYAMTATGEVEKRIWIGTAVSVCVCVGVGGGGSECMYMYRLVCVWNVLRNACCLTTTNQCSSCRV